ncbi:hypothetical protein [Serratia fonticola]|uniref:hypothetical protein n=1 Tax=Serratia fonticola TaxID=47917 RepID=UPI001C46A073|nr:hypothetical protein [Serratia fonticola]QXN65286.1 hypothetical protein J8M99_25900 [Serratia fonticola]
MHTQNINVNGATEASRICEKTTPRFDGFITNVDASNSQDVIRATAVLMRLEKEAAIGCGCYAEIFEQNLLSLAWDYYNRLPLLDSITFFGAALQRGITLTWENMGLNDPAAYCFEFDGDFEDDHQDVDCPF